MRVIVADSAKRDLVDGFDFYHLQEPSAGWYFLDCMYSDIDSLSYLGGIHSKSFKQLHRMVCSKHPFAIHYELRDETVRVVAVLDGRRSPAWIKKKLRLL